MRRLIGLLASAILMAASGWTAEAAEPVVREAEWAHKPDADTMSAYYPEDVADRSVSGRVTVLCEVNVEGALHDCRVELERPAGLGFGEAAVKLATQEFRMRPRTVNGVPETSTVRIPVILLVAGSPESRYVVLDPVWSKAPTFDDMIAAWPAAAKDLPSGTAALRCDLASTGRLRDCAYVGGIGLRSAGFGDAAKGLVDRFEMKMTPGERVKYSGASVIVSFRFFNPATPAGQERKVVKPQWITKIDPKKVVALYPQAAADKGVASGTGTADCEVAPDGRLVDCRPGREEPADLGFAAAAVAVAGVTQMNPWTPDGRPVQGARVRLPIVFNLAEEVEASPAP